MSVFTALNTSRARVYDIDTKQELKYVASVDTVAMELVCYEFPLRCEGERMASFTIKYRAIHPIYGGGFLPCLFHCYGRGL